MLINVTQEHIDNGVQRSCKRCPVALAISSLMKPPYSILVGDESAFVQQQDELRFETLAQISLPGEATYFIVDFDCGLDVEPFSFEIDIPQEFLC